MTSPLEKERRVARRLRGEDDSEFGRGFLQQLLYFYKHFGEPSLRQIYGLQALREGRITREKLLKDYPILRPDLAMWGEQALEHRIGLFMNGASDHLYDFEIPESLPEVVQLKANELRDLVLDMGHGQGLSDRSFCTMEKFSKVHELVLEIVRMIDLLVFDVVVDEGEYQ